MISLSAEQKTIEGIFCTTTEMYVIPAYQRPYSWGFDQFYELYRDLIGAYNNNDSYFLGNIIMAKGKSYDEDGMYYVVDGQQRIITLWTLIKMLSLFLPDINSLQSALYVIPWEGKKKLPKINSMIFENRDDKAIEAVLEYDKAKLETRYHALAINNSINSVKVTKDCTTVEYALFYFYQQLIVLQKEYFNLAGFAQFLMKKVTMLPIVQSAEKEADAENKALTIFETINNRGVDLEDADIFKARLYDSAYKEEQRSEFISLWRDFKASCDGLHLTVDDVFRYYSHVIRGREQITSPEKRLRDFFTNEPFSPLKTQSYKEVLEDLNKILRIHNYLDFERSSTNEISNWLKIISAYTNQYPLYAIIVYLYYHDVDTKEEEQDFIYFLQSLIRYCFYMGSTTTVKFQIYNIIKIIANRGRINSNNVPNATPEMFSYLGRLQSAFALLAYYLESHEPIPPRFSIDKIVNLRDEEMLGEDWKDKNLYEICNSIGNLVVLDLPKRYNAVTEKYDYYMLSRNEYVRSVLTSPTFTFEDWQKRNNRIKELLTKFFS